MANNANDYDDIPLATCPECRAQQRDDDGFGVLYCGNCGYCAHPSLTDGVCELCKEGRQDER